MHARGLGNQVVLVLIIGTALMLAPAARLVLPEQYLLDDGHLRESMAGRMEGLDSTSFARTAGLYRLLGVSEVPTAAALLGMVLFAAAVIAALGWERIRELSPLGLGVLGVSMALALVYLAQYSKELITLAIGLLVLVAPRSRWGDAMILGACLLYAGTLRPYWVIIAVLFVIWRWALVHVRRPVLLLLIPVLAYLALTPLFELVLGTDLQSQREWSNQERGPLTPVASIIHSPIPGARGLLGVASVCLMLVLLVVPLPLLATGSPVHAVSALLITGIWALVLVPIARGRLVGVRSATGVRAARAAALLLALLLTQALFEPDYGSTLKHLTPLLPLVLALVALRAPNRAEDSRATRELRAPVTEVIGSPERDARPDRDARPERVLSGAVRTVAAPPRPRGAHRAPIPAVAPTSPSSPVSSAPPAAPASPSSASSPSASTTPASPTTPGGAA